MLKLLLKAFLLMLIIQTTLISREINIDNIVQKANASNKHLFVWLHKTDCGYCESMKEFTLDNDAVKFFVKKKFIFVHINIYEKDSVTYGDFIGSGREFAKLVGYDFYPTSLFFSQNGDIGYAVPGYQDEKIFFTILNYIDSKAYKKVDFEIFENDFDFKEKL